MKLQHLTIIFIIIIFPIALVVGEYIQGQIDTISLQANYNKILQDATYDSIRTFEINTVNNKYSTVSDSKVRDIEASINTFYTSLGTSLGSSGYTAEVLKEYVPALVYTLYDGYYIYSKYAKFEYNKTKTSYGKTTEYEYGLRPYIFYACRYKSGSNDFVVNYTLDNCITIYGTINGSYVTKSGYLIYPNSVQNISYANKTMVRPNGSTFVVQYPSSLKYYTKTIEPEILSEQLTWVDDAGGVNRNTYEYTVYNNQKIYRDGSQYFTFYKNKKLILSDSGKALEQGEVTPLMYARDAMTWGGHLHCISGLEYYINAKTFSTWVQNNIGSISKANAYDQYGNPITNFSTDTGTSKIFSFNDLTNDPIMEGSIFDEHRLSVIRYSIESNLRSAIASFGSGFTGTYDFELPNLSEQDWNKIANNVSLTAFLQGIPIKQKMFNSYCTVINTRNEEVVKPDSLYVMTKNASGEIEAHLPGCEALLGDGVSYTVLGIYNLVDFERQTITISDENYVYNYPQYAQRCYKCISGAGKSYDITWFMKGYRYTYKTANDEISYVSTISSGTYDTYRIKFLTALGRARWDLYRNNSYIN